MKRSLGVIAAVTFLSSSSIALAGQTSSPAARTFDAISGAATAAAGFTLHGTVEHAGAPWALRLLASAGLGVTASTIGVATAGSVVTGLGIYRLTRGIVGTDPTSAWRMGLPGFVSGGILAGIGGEGIVQLGVAMAAGTAGLGLAMAATSIIAVVGAGFLAYGGWLAWKAHRAKIATAAAADGSNVARNEPTRPDVSPSVAPATGTGNLGFHH